MLSRLFLISTLLLVGITTVAIGAAIGKTIEVTRAFKILQMVSGNILNRRFIPGVPGLPQCTNENFPQLTTSFCLNAFSIRAICTSQDRPGWVYSDTTCPNDTSCIDFISDPEGEIETEPFAVCIDKKFIKRFDSEHKDGIFCKTYEINGVTNRKATISINIYDGTQRPARVSSVRFTVGNQLGSKFNTYNYSRVVDCNNGEKIKVCLDTGTTNELFGLFSYLDGTYG